MDEKTKIEGYIKMFENAIEHLAFARRMAELDGCDMTYLDEKINELCTKWHDKYAEMNESQLTLKGVVDVVEAGYGEDLLRDLLGINKE